MLNITKISLQTTLRVETRRRTLHGKKEKTDGSYKKDQNTKVHTIEKEIVD